MLNTLTGLTFKQITRPEIEVKLLMFSYKQLKNAL